MKIDYKKELESASRSMIMIHDPRLLIKLIIRTIVHKLEVRHAGMILFEPKKNIYILDVSQGERGVKAPQGFMRFNDESPIIRLFKKEEFKRLTVNRSAIVSSDINKMIWRETVVDRSKGNGIKELLHSVDEQMQMLNAVACVPAYYQEGLMAVLLLGEKLDGSKFEQDELDFFSALASDAAMAIRNAQLFEDLSKEAARNKKLFIQTIIALSSAIEAKDPYTKGHTERVTTLSLVLARQMELNQTLKLNEGFMENLYIAGLLHDIGKIAVPEQVLNKPGRLNNEEYEIIKIHPLKGVEIIESLEIPEECLAGIRFHHERYDGTGYPSGLKADQIPIAAAIISVADSFDAMTTDRPYRTGLAKDKAMEEIRRCCGTQFHPLVVKATEELWDKGLI